MISTVIFDLGRVLVAIDFEAFPNALNLRTPESRAPYAAATAEAGHLYERGKISTDEFTERLFTIFGGRYTRRDLLSAWDEIIRVDVPGMAALVERVQARCATAMLSNTSSSHFEKAAHECATVQLVRRRFLSYEIGTAKPDPVIYKHVIDSLGVPPGEILFIDDLKENIDGAREAGMNGIIFTDIERLERDLYEWKVLTPPPH